MLWECTTSGAKENERRREILNYYLTVVTANAIGSFYEANSNFRLYNIIIYYIYNFRHKKKDFIVTLLDLSLIEKSSMYL